MLPLKDICDLAGLLIERGMSEGEAIDQIADMVDQMIDFRKVIPNREIGAAVEAIDDKLIATIIKIAVSLSKAKKWFGRK